MDIKPPPPFLPIQSAVKPSCDCIQRIMKGESTVECPFEHRVDGLSLTYKSIPSPRLNFDATRKRILDAVTTTSTSVVNTFPYIEEMHNKAISTGKESASVWQSATPVTALSRFRIENMIQDYTILLEKLEEWVCNNIY